MPSEERWIDAERFRVRPDIALRCLGRFLHHFAELSRKRQAAAPGQESSLNVKNVAPSLRPSESRRNAERQ